MYFLYLPVKYLIVYRPTTIPIGDPNYRILVTINLLQHEHIG